MITKLKTGILTLIPFLSGKVQADADSFFKSIDGDSVKFENTDISRYKMVKIQDDWYIEFLIKDDVDFDPTAFTCVTSGKLDAIQDCTYKLKTYICDKLAIEFESSPVVFMFVGDWKDEGELYNKIFDMDI